MGFEPGLNVLQLHYHLSILIVHAQITFCIEKLFPLFIPKITNILVVANLE